MVYNKKHPQEIDKIEASRFLHLQMPSALSADLVIKVLYQCMCYSIAPVIKNHKKKKICLWRGDKFKHVQLLPQTSSQLIRLAVQLLKASLHSRQLRRMFIETYFQTITIAVDMRLFQNQGFAVTLERGRFMSILVFVVFCFTPVASALISRFTCDNGWMQ